MPPLDLASLRDDVECLAALGPRFAGADGEARARDLLTRELTAAGLEVIVEEFVHLAYEPGESSCVVIEPTSAGAAAASLPPTGAPITGFTLRSHLGSRQPFAHPQ